MLTRAVFSFRTNKRLFQGVIHLSNDERWRRLFQCTGSRSRWDVTDDDVERYLDLARHLVLDFLVRGATSRACGLDPIGAENLKLAKKIRRRTLYDARLERGWLDLERRRVEVAAMAEMHFAIPAVPLLCDSGALVAAQRASRPTLAEAEPGPATEFWTRFAGAARPV